MMKEPTISPSRVVEIFEEMISCRRIEYADTDFFRMSEVWSDRTSGSGTWRIKFFSSNLGDEYQRKAAVMSFGDQVTLTVDRELWGRAVRGELFSNFMLGHELGHIALNHHSRSATTKHFKLTKSVTGMYSIIPPNVEELEANLAAVFFQCGKALTDTRWNIVELAKRAFTDIGYAKKARDLLLSAEVQEELNKPRPKYERVAL